MTIETMGYGGWEHCLRLTDGRIEAVVTTDVGPRIIRFGLVGGPNLLHENPAQRGLTGGDEWRAYGGHRLWHAPEAKPRTYVPDNGPVPYRVLGDGLILSSAVEAATGIEKQMEVRLEEGGLRLIHRLTNRNPWAVELAPWAITIMAPGGVAVMPQEPYAPHPDIGPDRTGPAVEGDYLPVRSLALWAYTRMNDPRWSFLERFILTRQEPVPDPLKYGVSNHQGWCGYLLAGTMLLKRFDRPGPGNYPDLGCNAEVFTDSEMLELETLGPLAEAAPGQTIEHGETWSLLQNLPLAREGAELEAALLARM